MIDSAPDRPDLHYDLAGDGLPIVFTHGWLNDGDVWSGSVDSLSGRARCLAWDLRGHGRSQPAAAGRYGRDLALADLDRMIDVAGAPAILVGHSLGGYLSLAHAIERPDRVAGLALVAAGPGFRSDDSRERWNDSVRAIAARSEIPEGMEEISMHVDAMVMDRLGEIEAPTSVVVGERDERFQASAAVFEKHLRVVHHDVVPEAGHMVHLKFPENVARAVDAVIAAIGG